MSQHWMQTYNRNWGCENGLFGQDWFLRIEVRCLAIHFDQKSTFFLLSMIKLGQTLKNMMDETCQIKMRQINLSQG